MCRRIIDPSDELLSNVSLWTFKKKIIKFEKRAKKNSIRPWNVGCIHFPKHEHRRYEIHYAICEDTYVPGFLFGRVLFMQWAPYPVHSPHWMQIMHSDWIQSWSHGSTCFSFSSSSKSSSMSISDMSTFSPETKLKIHISWIQYQKSGLHTT